MRSFLVRTSFLSVLTVALFSFAHWAADGFDPLLFTPVRGDRHPAWIIEPYGAMALGSMMGAYLYVVVRKESVPRQRWFLFGAVTFATVFLALWPDIYGTLRFGSIDVIEWRLNAWFLPQLHGTPRWICLALLQLVLVGVLVRRKRDPNGVSVDRKAFDR